MLLSFATLALLLSFYAAMRLAKENSKYEKYNLSAQCRSLPSPELMIELEDDLLDQAEWTDWAVDCYRLAGSPINTINEPHYRLIFQEL